MQHFYVTGTHPNLRDDQLLQHFKHRFGWGAKMLPFRFPNFSYENLVGSTFKWLAWFWFGLSSQSFPRCRLLNNMLTLSHLLPFQRKQSIRRKCLSNSSFRSMTSNEILFYLDKPCPSCLCFLVFKNDLHFSCALNFALGFKNASLWDLSLIIPKWFGVFYAEDTILSFPRLKTHVSLSCSRNAQGDAQECFTCRF